MRKQERRDAKRDIRREMKGKPPVGTQPGDRRDRPPAGRVAVIGRALGLLSLTPDQRRTLRQIRARSDERMRHHGRRVLDLRREIDANLFGETLALDAARAKGRELAAIIGERTTERTNVELAVFETLTAAQRAEVRAARDAQRARVREALKERGYGPQDPPPAVMDETGEPPPDDELDADGANDDATAGGPPDTPGAGPRRQQRRPAGMPGLLADMGVTPEQFRRLRQLRRQQAPRTRQSAFRFRELQLQIDDMLLAEKIDSARLKELAVQLGQADAERELVRFESEAGIREILTAQQAAIFRERRRRQWNESRDGGPASPEPEPHQPPKP